MACLFNYANTHFFLVEVKESAQVVVFSKNFIKRSDFASFTSLLLKKDKIYLDWLTTQIHCYRKLALCDNDRDL
jgi:hypothetical protein